MPEEAQEQQLKRRMGYWTVLALAIGSIMGTTLYFGTPIGAKHSGNLLIPAWIILSAIALYMAAIFGELSAMFPKAGGAYEFSKQAYGKFAAFIIAWTAWLFGSISTVIIIIAAVNSLNLPASQFEKFLISVAIIVALNAIAYIGIEASSWMLLIVAAAVIAIPLIIFVKGFPAINPANLLPMATHKLSSIFVTLFFMAEAYFGWEAVTYLAEETRNPTKTIPKALIYATAIIAILGLVIISTTLGILSWQKTAETTSPLTEISGMLYGTLGTGLLTAGIFVALIGTAAGTVISMPRLLLALARDRLFMEQFKKLHPKLRTPANAILFQTVVLVMLLLLGLANYQIMLELLVPMAGVLYISMIIAIVVLRRKKPLQERPFKAWLSPWGPIIAALFFIAIISTWLLTSPGAGIFFQTSISLIAISIPLYLMVELYYDPKMITQANDIAAYATFIFQKITGSGKESRKRLIEFFGDVKGKTILEYGCGVGSLTLELLKAVGPSGKVIATHFSKNNVKITKKRIEVSKWQTETWAYGNANVIHDPEQMTRVHPDIGYADAVVSIGILGYVQNIKKVLKELAAIMPTGGKLAFIEHADFFHIIPNVEWLGSDAAVEKLFREAGFAVKVKRQKGLLWNSVYVYGIKYTGTTAYV